LGKSLDGSNNGSAVIDGLVYIKICQKVAEIIVKFYKTLLKPSIINLIKKLIDHDQNSYISIFHKMDMPDNPGQFNLARLQTILSGRPSLINLLKTHQLIVKKAFIFA